MIASDAVYVAQRVATYLEIPRRDLHWHDDLYDEHFAFCGVPSDAIVGHAKVRLVTGPEINILLPHFSHLDPHERLYESLCRFQ